MRVIGCFVGTVFLALSVFLAMAAVGALISESWKSAIFAGVLAISFFAAAIFGFLGMRGRKSWRDDPATDRQKSFADELGIKYHRGISKGELSDLISEVTGK